MPGTFTISRARNGKLYFNLKSPNGEIILASQGYRSRSGCRNGIASVQENAGTPSRFETRTSRRGQTYFVLKARNGHVIGQSQMYQSDRAREIGMASVRKNAPQAQLARG